MLANGAAALVQSLHLRAAMQDGGRQRGPHEGGRPDGHGHPMMGKPGGGAAPLPHSRGSLGGPPQEPIDLAALCCNSAAELKAVREALETTRAELAAAREDAAVAKEEVAKRDAELRRTQVELQRSRGEAQTARAELLKAQAELTERDAQGVDGSRDELQKKLLSTTLLVLQLAGLDSQITPELWLQTPGCAQDLLLQYAMQGALNRAVSLWTRESGSRCCVGHSTRFCNTQ